MDLVVLEHLGKPGDAARRQCVHRSGTDAVDADFFRAEIVGEVARARFEGSLGHPHHVVMRHHFLRTVVGHRDDAAPFGHQRRRAAGERHQRIRAHIVRDAEGFAARVHKLAFERVLRRKRDGMQQQVQLAKFLSDLVEHAGDVIILRHVAFHQQRVCAERAGEFLDVLLEPFALVREGELRAFAVPCLRDGPGDGAFVRDAEDDSEFAGEQGHKDSLKR